MMRCHLCGDSIRLLKAMSTFRKIYYAEFSVHVVRVILCRTR